MDGITTKTGDVKTSNSQPSHESPAINGQSKDPYIYSTPNKPIRSDSDLWNELGAFNSVVESKNSPPRRKLDLLINEFNVDSPSFLNTKLSLKRPVSPERFHIPRPLQLKTPPPKISVITPLRSPKKETASPHKNVDLNKHTLIHHFNFEKDESSKRVHKELLLKENKVLEKKELVEMQNSNSVDSNNSNSNSANPLFLLSPPINSSPPSFKRLSKHFLSFDCMKGDSKDSKQSSSSPIDPSTSCATTLSINRVPTSTLDKETLLELVDSVHRS